MQYRIVAIFLGFFFFLSLGSLQAQIADEELPKLKDATKQWRGGLTAGINFSTFSTSFEKDNTEKTVFSDHIAYRSKIGYRFGFSVERYLGKRLWMQPSLLASFKKIANNHHVSTSNVTEKVDEKYEFWYLELPIKIAYAIPISHQISVKLFLGPYLAMGLKGVGKYSIQYANKEKNEEYFKSGEDALFGSAGSGAPYYRLDAGFSIGAGILFENVYLALAYDFGFHNYAYQSHWNPNNDNRYKQFNRNFQVTISYLLF